ncbi:MAG: hypothetical protein ACFE0O_14055 [Opitutales bacterium]
MIAPRFPDGVTPDVGKDVLEAIKKQGGPMKGYCAEARSTVDSPPIMG